MKVTEERWWYLSDSRLTIVWCHQKSLCHPMMHCSLLLKKLFYPASLQPHLALQTQFYSPEFRGNSWNGDQHWESLSGWPEEERWSHLLLLKAYSPWPVHHSTMTAAGMCFIRALGMERKGEHLLKTKDRVHRRTNIQTRYNLQKKKANIDLRRMRLSKISK